MARTTVEKNISYDSGKKLYYVNMDYGKDENGRRVKKTKTYKTKSEAKTALKEFEADKTKGQLVIPKKTTLKEWLDFWMENIVKPNKQLTTYHYYKSMIDKYTVPLLGSIPIQDLKPIQIQKYYTQLKKLSPNTIRKHHDMLHLTLGIAVKQEQILQNPVERVEPPQKQRKEAKFYDLENLKKLYEVVKNTDLEVTVKLGGGLGLRREEICGLRWKNIDLENKKVRICEARTLAGTEIVDKDTKNRTSNRTLGIPADIIELLLKEKARQEKNKEYLGNLYEDSGYVVVREDGKPYRPNYLSGKFKKLIEANGLPPLTIHGLRHTFASVANAQGIPLFEIGKVLGHSTPSTTGMIYTHMFDDTHQATLEKVAQAEKAE
ncbi:MAG: site-specific integrase [Oscillospiraceae bacterium]|jgi:integrase|nr:site-specific integrase [Oscillospiraceae bacterium]